jgi:hypothetical protein
MRPRSGFPSASGGVRGVRQAGAFRPKPKYVAPPCLHEQGDGEGTLDEAVQLWDELFARFASGLPESAQFVPIRAQLVKSQVLAEAGRLDAALTTCERMLEDCARLHLPKANVAEVERAARDCIAVAGQSRGLRMRFGYGQLRNGGLQGIDLVGLMLERGGDHLLEGSLPVGEAGRPRGGDGVELIIFDVDELRNGVAGGCQSGEQCRQADALGAVPGVVGALGGVWGDRILSDEAGDPVVVLSGVPGAGGDGSIAQFLASRAWTV